MIYNTNLKVIVIDVMGVSIIIEIKLGVGKYDTFLHVVICIYLLIEILVPFHCHVECWMSVSSWNDALIFKPRGLLLQQFDITS